MPAAAFGERGAGRPELIKLSVASMLLIYLSTASYFHPNAKVLLGEAPIKGLELISTAELRVI